MSTIEESMAARGVIPITIPLLLRQQSTRLLLGVPKVIGWMKEVLPDAQNDGHDPDGGSPRDQFLTLGRRFIAGERLSPPLPKLSSPTIDGIWRVRTSDLRMVGWFPDRDVFVIAEIDLKANCTNMRDNQMHLAALAKRQELAIVGGRWEKDVSDGLF